MKGLFSQQSPRDVRAIISVPLVASVIILSPTPGWSHSCSSQDLAIKVGETVEYVISGNDRLVRFEIHEAGDPQVITVGAPDKIDQNDLVFEITGVGAGTSEFRAYWEGPHQRGIYAIKAIVSG